MNIRKLFAGVALSLCAVMPARAQMTRSQLETDINEFIHANGTGGISGPILNGRLINIAESIATTVDANTFSQIQSFSGGASFGGALTLGSAQASYGQNFQVTAAYPGLGSSNDISRVAVGGYPVTDEYGAVGFITSAITGAITTPSGSFTGNQFFDAGVSGYCQTNNTTRACVGGFFEGDLMVAEASAWGINTETINCEGHNSANCGPGLGLNLGKFYGSEPDLTIYAVGSNPPTGQAFGVFPTLFAQAIPTGGAFAFNCGVNVYPGSTGQWSFCVTSQDGGATVFAEIGATARPAANLGSQVLEFNWYNGSSALGLVTLNADAAGNLDLNTNLIADSSSVNGTGAFLNNISSGGKEWSIVSSGSSSTGGAGKLGITDVTDSVNGLTVAISGAFANLGINVTSPVAPLDVHVTTNQNLLVQNNSGLSISTVNDAGNANVPLNIIATTLTLNAASVVFDGSALSNSPSGGVGYATGAGGTVTQGTSKTTGVTLNTLTGAITLNNALLAAGTIVSFTLTDSSIAATDTLVLNHISGGTIGSYGLNAAAAAGSATIYVRNNTAGSLSEAIVIEFAIIKGATA